MTTGRLELWFVGESLAHARCWAVEDDLAPLLALWRRLGPTVRQFGWRAWIEASTAPAAIVRTRGPAALLRPPATAPRSPEGPTPKRHRRPSPLIVRHDPRLRPSEPNVGALAGAAPPWCESWGAWALRLDALDRRLVDVRGSRAPFCLPRWVRRASRRWARCQYEPTGARR